MSDRPVLDARWYAALTAGAVLFTVYGSLVPFHYAARPWADAVEAFGRVLAGGVDVSSRSDWLANCLLGVPLGFCLLGAVRVDRAGGVAAVRTAALLWPPCVLVAAAVEFAQLYFPGRSCSASDVLAQSLGSAVGLLAWLLVGQRVTGLARRVWSDPRAGGAAGQVLVGYLALVALIQWLPFDIETSPGSVWHRVKGGWATVVPFAELSQTEKVSAAKRWAKAESWLGLVGLFLPAGMLAARLPGRLWRRGAGLPAVAAGGFLVAAATEAGQLFVSRHPSVTDAIFGGVGAVVGWAAVRGATRPAPTPGMSPELAVVLGQVWLALLVGVYWQPFEFGVGHGLVTYVPFADRQASDYLWSLDKVLERLVLFLPIGVLVAAVGPIAVGRGQAVWAGVLGLGVSAVLEAGQNFLPGRYPSATDLFTAAVGAWAGAAVARHVRARTRRPHLTPTATPGAG